MDTNNFMAVTEPLPLFRYWTPPTELDKYTKHLVTGLGRVLFRHLLHCTPRNGWIPQTLCERLIPLCDAGVPMCSFVWTEPTYTLHTRAARLAAEEFVMIAARCLNFTPNELVASAAIFKACILAHPSILKPYTFRVIALACFCLAVHMCNDYEITNTRLSVSLSPYFTEMSPKRIAMAQRQILVILNWRLPLKRETYDTCKTDLEEASCLKNHPTTTTP